MNEGSFFKSKLLNGWNLFWLITVSISVSVIIPYQNINTSNAIEISSMIQQSVRLAVPWLFIAFAASSLVAVFPNDITKWIMRNRKIFGLCFASGMAWQLFFILWLVIGFFDYFMAEAYYPPDFSEQLIGYLVLIPMTITSFKFGRKMVSNNQWRILHTWGIYFLWLVLWSTYWFELYYYDDIQIIDYFYYVMGIGAWLVRYAAWMKKREVVSKALTAILVFVGVFLISMGDWWARPVLDLLPKTDIAGWIELVIPFIATTPLFLTAFTTKPVIRKKGN